MAGDDNEKETIQYWCSSCGDQDYYADLECRKITWCIVDKKTGVGLCADCARLKEGLNTTEDEDNPGNTKDD